MAARHNGASPKYEAVELPIWQEFLVGVEMLYLRISPVYWGFGIPRGNGSAVVVIPGFLGTDLYLTEFRAWLRRIGYKSYYSGIGLNAECPNLLIRHRLTHWVWRPLLELSRARHLRFRERLAASGAGEAENCPVRLPVYAGV